MNSFCDDSIFFFQSDYLVTDLVTIIIHRKRSLVFYKQSSQRDVEESTGLLQSDSKEKKKHGHIQSLPEYRVTRYESVLLQKQSYHYCITTTSIVLQEQTVHTGIYSPVSYTSLKKNWKIFEKGLSYTYNVSRICIVYACSIAG